MICDQKLNTKIFFTIYVQLAEMNSRMVVNKPLYVALAQRKEERRARLQVLSIFSSQTHLNLQRNFEKHNVGLACSNG